MVHSHRLDFIEDGMTRCIPKPHFGCTAGAGEEGQDIAGTESFAGLFPNEADGFKNLVVPAGDGPRGVAADNHERRNEQPLRMLRMWREASSFVV